MKQDTLSLPCAAGAREEHRGPLQHVGQQLQFLEVPFSAGVLRRGKHVAVPEVPEEHSHQPGGRADGAGQRCAGGARTVLGGPQASQGETPEDWRLVFLTKQGLFCGFSGIARVWGAAKNLALSWHLLVLYSLGMWQQLVAPVAHSDWTSGAKMRGREEGGLNVGGYILWKNKPPRALCSAGLPRARRLLQPP